MFLGIIHQPVFYLKTPSCLYITKHNISETGFYLRLQVEPAQLGPIDRASPYLRTSVPAPRWGTQAKHSTNHLRELRKQGIILKKKHTSEALHQRTIKTEIITGEMKYSLWYQHKKNNFSHSVYTGQSCSFLTPAVIMGVQIDKDSTMHKVQKHNICTTVPLSQTFRSYMLYSHMNI
jgi:hypothetical protein